MYADHNDGRVAFPGDYPLAKSEVFLQSKDGARLIDLKKHTIEKVPLPDEVVAIGWGGQLLELPEPRVEETLGTVQTHELRIWLMAETPGSLILFDPRVTEREQFPLPKNLVGRYPVVHLVSEDLLATIVNVADSYHETTPGIGQQDIEVLLVDSSGTILQDETVSVKFSTGFSPASEKTMMNLLVISVPGTLTSSLISGVWMPLMLQGGDRTFSDVAGVCVATTWPAVLAATLLSLVLCRLVDRRQKEYRLPRSWGWLLFVFLLGLPGYIGYQLHRKWPVKSPLQQPALTGCEIIAG